VGEPMTVGERTIQPVARVAGWRTAGGNASGGAGAWLRVTPVELVVREGEINEYRIPITDGTRTVRRRMAVAALLVAVGCWLLMRALRRKAGAHRHKP
jgi:hypothetical protein